MYLENLAPLEIERIAYLTGDTMAARAFGDYADNQTDLQALENDIDNALDLVGCSGERGQILYASMCELSNAGETSKTLISALQTIATCYQNPSKPTRKQLDSMARVILEITACLGDYSPESARQAIYLVFGHEV